MKINKPTAKQVAYFLIENAIFFAIIFAATLLIRYFVVDIDFGIAAIFACLGAAFSEIKIKEVDVKTSKYN